jgi:imidazoleglycerol-phosphate dehydratase / histidinol-phosphatase
MNSQKKIAFIDRDGTMIFEPQDTYQVDTVEQLQILPGVIEELRRIQSGGFELVLVTNQDGLGTPSYPRTAFDKVQDALLAQLKAGGIEFYRIFICPHKPEENCLCRKPKIGLLESFLKEEQVDLEKSFVVGDRESDIELAKNIGVRAYRMSVNGKFPRKRPASSYK